MVKVTLKKLLSKPELSSNLENLIKALNISINIRDEQGELILCNSSLLDLFRYPIKAREIIIGWVEGEEKAAIVAETLSCIASQELEKKLLAVETLEKYEEINFLYDLSAKISLCLSIEEISDLLISEIKKLVNPDRISIMLVNSKKKTLTTIANFQPYANLTEFNSEIVNYVLKTGKLEMVNNFLSNSNQEDTHQKFCSLICLPLTIQNRTIGVVNISHLQPIIYSSEDLKLLMALTSQSATAIQAAQYYDKLKDYSYTLEQQVAKRTKALQRAKEKLEKLATTDQLTTLANRRKFDQYFHYEWRRSIREKIPISLILCDVDYFKLYNDHYGHPAGDKCLKKVATVMKTVVKRSADLLARYGGEEFAIVLSNTDSEGAQKVAEDIRSCVEKRKIPHRVIETNNSVTVSLGISTTIPTSQCSAKALLKAADKALYQAKNSGRNQVCVCPLQ